MDIHHFLNAGLGLPVADSFFGISPKGEQLALFTDWNGKKSPDYDFVLEAIESGLLDSLHTWADCNQREPDPPRLLNIARKTTDALKRKGLRIPVWINHGANSNLHNLKARLKPRWQGDDPASPLFTANLLGEIGIRFYWWSEIVEWPLSLNRPKRRVLLWRRGTNAVKNRVKRAMGRAWKQAGFSALTKLAVKVRLRSAQMIYGFSRYNCHPKGKWTLPTRETIRYALTNRFLQDLADTQGWAILYTHLGLPVKSGSPFLPPDAKALEMLAQSYQDGFTWVAPTAQLLAFWDLTANLVWSMRNRDRQAVISLHGRIGLDGEILPVTEAQVQGLAFYCPTPEKTSILIGNQPVSTVVNPKDREGLASITVGRVSKPGIDLL